ncbi:hypothetical protein [Comamonas sp. JNW]|uniref:hypothetical protein n=1 Tax=Comamonas sp. JNW TaxID=2170731 RepID=UPI001057EB17|nr:hypothetical protein [Comamonas sp. JNW]
MNSSFAGLRVVKSAMAIVMKEEWAVRMHPTPKRRRRWTVRRETYMAPGIIRLDHTLYVHPEIYAELIKPAPKEAP